mgnify:CR=1 FL=1
MAILKYSRQRESIQEFLNSSCDHPTADAVYMNVRQQYPNISLGTVYRNLNQLANEGQIRRLTVPGQPDRYDRNPVPHGHLVCRQCGKLEDLFLPDLIPYLEERSGQEITHYELTMGHICTHCKVN